MLENTKTDIVLENTKTDIVLEEIEMNAYRCECDDCPYNVGHDGNGFDHRKPCDQQNCWYDL